MDKQRQEPVLPPVPTGPAAEPPLEGEPTAPRYTNRCGRTYMVCEGKTGSGKVRYFVSPTPSGKPVASMPEGYEFYEHPKDGQVVVRKIRLTEIIPSGTGARGRRNQALAAAERGDHRRRGVCPGGLYAVAERAGHRRNASPAPRRIPPAVDQPLNVFLTKQLTYGKTLRFELLDTEREGRSRYRVVDTDARHGACFSRGMFSQYFPSARRRPTPQSRGCFAPASACARCRGSLGPRAARMCSSHPPDPDSAPCNGRTQRDTTPLR